MRAAHSVSSAVLAASPTVSPGQLCRPRSAFVSVLLLPLLGVGIAAVQAAPVVSSDGGMARLMPVGLVSASRHRMPEPYDSDLSLLGFRDHQSK